MAELVFIKLTAINNFYDHSIFLVSLLNHKHQGHVGQLDTLLGCVHVCPSANVPPDKSDMSVKCLACPHRRQTKPFASSHVQHHFPVASCFGV